MSNRIADGDFEQRVISWVSSINMGRKDFPLPTESVVWAIVQDEALLNEVLKRRQEYIDDMNEAYECP